MGNTKQNLYWQLFQVAITSKHELMEIGERYKLSVMQLYALCLLDEKTSMPMNSLSTTLHCDASNVTGIVDKLLQLKYIIRAENPHDRREKIIKLTAKGSKIAAKLASEIAENPPISLSHLSEKERASLSQILSTVLEIKTTNKK